MSAPTLATKLYIPPLRSTVVPRPGLVGRLNEGLASGRKLTLISASAGFGKTTLVSEWIAGCGRPIAWVSLDEGDNDPVRFLSYLLAALQTIQAEIGEGLSAALQSPQPPSAEAVLTALLNEIITLPDAFVLVLDDYHVIDSQPVDKALTFLLEHQPPQMHLVLATREDPSLPLARLRARGQLTELRAADLRFTPAEAAEFLNRVMGLDLSDADVAALEARTEGWIAGLQMAAISMQGLPDAAGFIQSFTGSHRFVLDYLLEEVLQRQPAEVQTFLLRTSILERLCGSLCDAVLLPPSASAQETLEYIERTNLFIIPLDNQRRWYRYHHLFGELLRKRLGQSLPPEEYAGLHIRASEWYESNHLMLEAFRHAVAADDIERAERLMESKGIPLQDLGATMAILNWLESLPRTVLDARPSLWVRSATSTIMAGQTTGIEEKLQAAEKAVQGSDSDDRNRDLRGQIAALRATLALVRYEPEAMILQARRALEYLHPDNLPYRSRATWVMGVAHRFLGERAAARQFFTEAIRLASGHTYYTLLASAHLGQIQESENQLYQAAETYRGSLKLFGDQGPPNASEEFIGLARICYEWNDLDSAEQYGQQSLQLSRHYDIALDRFVTCEVLLARLKLARGEGAGAAAMLAEAGESARRHNYVNRIPEIAAAQVITLLRQGNLAAAAHLAQMHKLPLSQARVYLAQGDPSAALALLSPYRQQMEAKDWQDERLKVMVLQAVALRAHGEKDKAAQVLGEVLALAEPGGFIRLFVDEGEAMRRLLVDFRLQIENEPHDPTLPGYVDKLLAAFSGPTSTPSEIESPKSKNDLLSPRESEVLGLIAQGLSNQEIGERLFLALDTVKGHNRRIFEKLQVQRRTEAIVRARELGLL